MSEHSISTFLGLNLGGKKCEFLDHKELNVLTYKERDVKSCFFDHTNLGLCFSVYITDVTC